MNVVFYGSHYWDRGPWFRKQYFAKNLVERGHRIFYIENSVSMMKWNTGYKNRLFKTKINVISDNLHVITPPAFYPFPNSYITRHLYYLRLVFFLKSYLKKQNVKNHLLWFNIINFSSVIRYLNPTKVIFDLSDDIPMFFSLSGNHKAYRTHMRLLKTAFKNADIAITTALKIKEKYQRLTRSEIIVIPNGHNIRPDDLHDVTNQLEEYQKIKHPIIGFLGTLFRFTDEKLLEFLISARPAYSFVFVGKYEPDFPVKTLLKYPNVYLLGERKKNEIAQHISNFDICINPFKVHEVNDSVSPLKVYEYLAMKKPVVSTTMYSLQNELIAQYIHFGNSYEEILEIIDQIIYSSALINDIPDEILYSYNWNNLFKRLLDQVREIHGLKL